MLVLLIEDNDDNALLAQLALELAFTAREVKTDVVHSAEMAQAAIRQQAYDVILVDYRLPGATGIDFIRSARAAGIDTPMIMLTVDDSAEVAAEAIRAGATDYMTKARLASELDMLKKVVGRALALRDEQQRRGRAEQALAASEERLRNLFQHSPAGVFIMTPDGDILDCNEAFARILGYDSREAVLRQGASQSALHRNPDERIRLISRLLAGEVVTNLELGFQRADGTAITVLMNAYQRRDGSGHIKGMLVDITAHQHAEQLRTATRLANAAAHEINNPLTAIFEYLHLLDEDPALGPESRLRVQRALAQAQRIHEIVQHMGHITRVEVHDRSSDALPDMLDIRRSAGDTV
jgi:PAS domain S-box-containing protein